MPLTKKIILCLVVLTVLLSSLSGCILDDLFSGGTSFSLNSWSICDDEGFAGLSINFSCSNTVTVKLLGPDSNILDSDFFFHGDSGTILHLAEYKHSVTPGQYQLKAYDRDNDEIYSKSFSFSGSDLTISSCEQKWWKRDVWIGGYSLFGLRMTVQNSGDTPAYPYEVTVTADYEENSSLAIPCVILPGESKYVDCLAYRDTVPDDSTFTINLKDIDENTMAVGYFSVTVQDNVPIKEFSWQYNGHRRQNIPKPEYLYDYHTSVDRIGTDDYSVYIFDPYDDQYINILIDCIMFGFTDDSDVGKINYIASFVQNLEYKSDSDTNSSYEYPRYPVETLFDGNGGGDCEDKAILTASLLNNLGYDVALLRLPNHMAVGVNLSESTLPNYEYYIYNYYYLETTTKGKPCGFIPTEYRASISEVVVHPISSRPLLIHDWKDGTITSFTNTEMGDFVKVTLIVQNLGIETATNVKAEGAFYTTSGLKSNSKSEIISSLEPGMKKVFILSVNIPKSWITTFKTKIYLNDKVVDEKESISTFPT